MLTNEQKIALVDAMGKKLFRAVPTKVLASVMGLSSMSAIARKVGASIWLFRHHVEVGNVPPPSFQLGRRWFYTTSETASIVREWENGSYRSPMWSAETIAEMKALYASGLTQWDIAEKFSCTQSTVSRLLKGRKYSRA